MLAFLTEEVLMLLAVVLETIRIYDCSADIPAETLLRRGEYELVNYFQPLSGSRHPWMLVVGTRYANPFVLWHLFVLQGHVVIYDTDKPILLTLYRDWETIDFSTTPINKVILKKGTHQCRLVKNPLLVNGGHWLIVAGTTTGASLSSWLNFAHCENDYKVKVKGKGLI